MAATPDSCSPLDLNTIQGNVTKALVPSSEKNSDSFCEVSKHHPFSVLSLHWMYLPCKSFTALKKLTKQRHVLQPEMSMLINIYFEKNAVASLQAWYCSSIEVRMLGVY